MRGGSRLELRVADGSPVAETVALVRLGDVLRVL
jgi:hypothetical protein